MGANIISKITDDEQFTYTQNLCLSLCCPSHNSPYPHPLFSPFLRPLFKVLLWWKYKFTDQTPAPNYITNPLLSRRIMTSAHVSQLFYQIINIQWSPILTMSLAGLHKDSYCILLSLFWIYCDRDLVFGNLWNNCGNTCSMYTLTTAILESQTQASWVPKRWGKKTNKESYICFLINQPWVMSRNSHYRSLKVFSLFSYKLCVLPITFQSSMPLILQGHVGEASRKEEFSCGFYSPTKAKLSKLLKIITITI